MPTFLKQDFTSGEKKVLPTQILTFAVILVVLLGLYYGSILYQQSIIAGQTAHIQSAIQQIDASRDKTSESKILIFANQLDNLDGLLKSRPYLSKFLKLLEDTVKPKVFYTDLNVDLDRQSVEIKGQAASYSALADQMVNLSQSPMISSLGLSDTIVQLGGVSFTLRGFLNPNPIK